MRASRAAVALGAFLFANALTPAPADIDLSGTIDSDTTLGPGGSSGYQDTLFNIVGDLSVRDGAALTIQAGVTLQCEEGVAIACQGILEAQGTETDRILFTRRTDQGLWEGLYLYGSGASGSVLEHCEVRWAETGIKIDNTSPTISDSIVTDCGDHGLSITGMNSNPTLTRVTTSANGQHGVAMSDNARAILESCTIEDNAGSGVWARNETPTLRHCSIRGNNTGGSSLGAGVVVRHTAVLEGNLIESNRRGGIRVENDADVPIIRDNILRHHNSYAISFAANPLDNAADRIAGNTFEGNTPNDRLELRGGGLERDANWVGAVQGLELDLNGPYLIRPGVTLTLSPGTVLRFPPHGSLSVQGVLDARGTETSPILLTRRLEEGDWAGLSFFGSGANGSVLEYCDIEWAEAGMRVSQASPVISDCTVRHCSRDGIRIEGNRSSPTLTRVTTGNNGQHGVSLSDNARAALESCTVEDNAGSGVWARNGTPTLRDGSVRGNNTSNYGLGAGVVVRGGAILEGNLIENNRRGGIRAEKDTDAPIIRDNTIRNNPGYAISVETNPLGADRIAGNTVGGNGADRIEFRGGGLPGDYTWVDRVDGMPVEITGRVTVNSGSTLTFEPGQQVIFGTSGHIWAPGGVVRAEGTTEPFSPIVFTSSASRPTAGSWWGFSMTEAGASASRFSYCVIRFARVGIDCENASPLVDHCTMVNCQTASVRSSVSSGGAANPIVKNSIVAFGDGSGILAQPGGDATVTYSVLFGNAGGNLSGVTPGEGIIEDDPLFRSDANLRLLPASPCINTGEPPPGAPLDADGSRSDMGAFPLAGPALASIEPTGASPGQSGLLLTLAGVNLEGLSAIDFLLEGEIDGDLMVGEVAVDDQGRQATATLAIAADAAPGDRRVRVAGARGVSAASLWPAFRVSSGGPPAEPGLAHPPENALLSPTPTFRLQPTDPDGDPVRCVIELTQGETILTFETGFAASGEEIRYTMPQTLAGGEWSWRARAVDDRGSEGEWSESRRLVVGPDVDLDTRVGDFELLDYIDAWARNWIEDFDLLDTIDRWATGAQPDSSR